MSIREQSVKHKWENRVRDWMIMPHGSLPSAKGYKQRIVTKKELRLHRPPSSPSNTDPGYAPSSLLQQSSSSTAAASATLWMAIDGIVYDVTQFVTFHPGGVKLMHQYSGIDASNGYHKHHTPAVDLDALLGGFKVGVLEGSELAEAALIAGLPPPPSYESALIKSSSSLAATSSTLNSNDIAAMAKKSQLFEGVSEQALLEAVANEVHRGSIITGSNDTQDQKSSFDAAAAVGGASSKEVEESPSSVGVGVSSQKEAEDEALLAIFDVLDKDGIGKVSLLAVAEFLVNIEACGDAAEAMQMVTALAEAEAVQQGYFTKPQYLKLAEQL